MNFDYLKDKIKNFEYISFDVFDTLIKRNVSSPTDVFELVQIKFNINHSIKINNFKEKRIIAEKKARELSLAQEPNIDDIYDNLEYDNKTINLLKDIEINVEYDVCVKNRFIYPLYEYCLKNNKKIIIASDMYLDKDFIRKILSKNNIVDFDKLYVSNDIKCSKYKGNMFKYILNDLKINSKSIIHIGDSKRADWILPKFQGITTIKIKKNIFDLSYYNPTNLSKEQLFIYKNICAYINNNLTYSNHYYKIGYEALGILLYSYSKWLLEKIKEDNINKVFFLAREGKLLKDAFDLINTDKNIESNYLYVSRRSTRVSLLKSINNLDDIFEIVKMRRITSIKDFFKNVGLDIENYTWIKEQYNIEEDINKVYDFNNIFETIKKDIINNAVKEEKLLISYLEQESFKGKVAICDVGWVGTMQNSIESIVKLNNINVEIYGYYIGQHKTSEQFIKNGMKSCGFLFNYNSNRDIEVKLRGFLNLFEIFFLAEHGSTIKYALDDYNKFMPILDKYEYSNEELQKIKSIQKGALQFISDYNNYFFSDILKVDSKIAFKEIEKLGVYPRFYDIKLFNDVNYLDTNVHLMIPMTNSLYYIIKPNQLYIDFCNSRWKIGFLKKVFRLNLSYINIYKLLIKFLDK